MNLWRIFVCWLARHEIEKAMEEERSIVVLHQRASYALGQKDGIDAFQRGII